MEANKTIREWLNELEEPYRTQAINNSTDGILDTSEDSLQESLACAFFWCDSPEGSDYWNDLHDTLCENNK